MCHIKLTLRVICLGPLVGGHAADNWTIRIMPQVILMTSVSCITKPQAITDYMLVGMINLFYSQM